MLPEKINPFPAPGDPSDPRVTLRVRFSKTGMLKYISHLDLLRTVQSALIRARIPVWYTEGFNPHQKLVFALPLSLGTESVCELLDVRLTHAVDPEEAKEALDRASPPGLRALEAYPAENKFTGICWAQYLIRTGAPVDLSPFEAPELIVSKRSKSGEKPVDIKPKIKSFALTDGGVRLVLRAAVNDFLGPETVAPLITDGEYSTLRTNVFFEDGVTPFR